MITNITSYSTTSKIYPRVIEWYSDGTANSIETHSYDSWNSIINKLIDAQCNQRKIVKKEIKYIRAKR